ncbi:bifunctional Riboflavin kinase domain [Babesia duncani]|uniref:riboflavin kinase n=1 Tax=Babesia duncani TaxID=323732 RepID=A0AAD9PGN6_9APIC|nr:bifunctional Riboflavin kinase domain [Babesia duncani]KAK2197446.1 bifunctional Riboflavin kinase domain [Babesia duncani]
MDHNAVKYYVVNADKEWSCNSQVLYNFYGLICNSCDGVLIPPFNRIQKLFPGCSGSTCLHSHIYKLIKEIARNDIFPSKLTGNGSKQLLLDVSKLKVSSSDRIKSFCSIFEGAALKCISVENNSVKQILVNKWDGLDVSKFTECVDDICFTGWYRIHDFIRNIYSLTNRKLNSNTKIKILLISNNKIIVDRLESFYSNENIFKLDLKSPFAFVGSIDSCTNYLSDDKSIAHVQFVGCDDDTINSIIHNLKVPSISFEKSSEIDEYIPQSNECKVNLKCNVDISNYSGIIGGFLEFQRPIFLSGTVVKGFGRGSAFLGIPTANLDCSNLPNFIPGVYYGVAHLHGNPEVDSTESIHAILSIGFNPQFNNCNYSIEPYLYREFKYSLLGQVLELKIKGFIRCEAQFKSINHLITAIDYDLQLHSLIIQNGSA